MADLHPRQSGPDHVCFGCHRELKDGEPHIHVPMDEWSATQGLEALGMDDLFTFVFCEGCTDKTKKRGWTLEAHPIGGSVDA